MNVAVLSRPAVIPATIFALERCFYPFQRTRKMGLSFLGQVDPNRSTPFRNSVNPQGAYDLLPATRLCTVGAIVSVLGTVSLLSDAALRSWEAVLCQKRMARNEA